MRAIAQNGAWVGIHLAIVVAVLLVIGGLVGLAHLLASGPAGPLARLGLAAALLGGAVVCVSTAIDGFGMRALARAWADAPPAEAATALRVAAAVQAATFGVWSVGMLVFFGAAFGCFGAAVNASGRFPGWFGWSAVAGGAGAAAAALLQIAHSGAVQAARPSSSPRRCCSRCGPSPWGSGCGAPPPRRGQSAAPPRRRPGRRSPVSVPARYTAVPARGHERGAHRDRERGVRAVGWEWRAEAPRREAPASGCRARSPETSIPLRVREAVPPVLTLCNRCPHALFRTRQRLSARSLTLARAADVERDQLFALRVRSLR